VSGEILSFGRKLDRGEQEAITLASSIHSDYLLVDDKRAQKECQLRGITYVSTFAVLLRAAQKGIIDDIEDVISRLEAKRIFLNRDLHLAAKNFVDGE